MKIFAGYDSGGTKTKCVLADENGMILSCGIGGPSNFLSCGFDIAESSIKQSTTQALKEAGLREDESIYSAFFGFASIELFSKNERVWNFLRDCVNTKYLGVNNDAYIAWYGTTYGKSGIISISGTGAVTVGICEDGRWKKVGGWGYLIGDEGSGYSIGRKALRLAIRSYDGVIPKNNFEKEIIDFYSLKSMRQLISMIYGDSNKSNTIIASAAKCVFKLFDEGDILASGIIGEAAGDIAKSISSVYSGLDLSGQFIKIGLSGGVFNSGKKFVNMINDRLIFKKMKNYELVLPNIPPEVSALVLSYKQVGNGVYEISEQKLVDRYKEIGAAVNF